MGRTGRAGQAGAAITLLGPSDSAFAGELAAMLQASGEQQQQQQQTAQAGGDSSDDSDSEDEEGGGSGSGGAAAGLQRYQRLTKAAVEGLRYRAEDVARSITKNVIKEVGWQGTRARGWAAAIRAAGGRAGKQAEARVAARHFHGTAWQF